MKQKVKGSGIPADEALEKVKAFIIGLELQRKELDSVSPQAERLPEKEFRGPLLIFGPVTLTGNDVRVFNDCVAELLDAAVRDNDRHSESAIESMVQTAVVEALDPWKTSPVDFSGRLGASILNLRGALRQGPKLWTVYLEVCGIPPEILPRQVGGMDFSYIADLADVLSEPPDIVLKQQRHQLRSMLRGQVRNKTYARVRVDANDSEAASYLAEKKLRAVLDALNFYASVFGSPRTFLFLPGDTIPVQVASVLDSEENCGVRHTIVGPLAPFAFGAISDSMANKSGFTRAISLLAQNNRNSLEERILSAIGWAGRATIEQRREEALLLYVIALECLLLKKDQTTEMRFRFAVRGAHLLSNNSMEVKHTFKKLLEVYDTRSKIVHSGNTQVSFSELSRVRVFARDAILTVLTGAPFTTMASEDDLENWFLGRVLGFPNSHD